MSALYEATFEALWQPEVDLQVFLVEVEKYEYLVSEIMRTHRSQRCLGLKPDVRVPPKEYGICDICLGSLADNLYGWHTGLLGQKILEDPKFGDGSLPFVETGFDPNEEIGSWVEASRGNTTSNPHEDHVHIAFDPPDSNIDYSKIIAARTGELDFKGIVAP